MLLELIIDMGLPDAATISKVHKIYLDEGFSAEEDEDDPSTPDSFKEHFGKSVGKSKLNFPKNIFGLASILNTNSKS